MAKKILNYFYLLLIIQFITALLIIVMVFIFKAADSPLYNDFKSFYEENVLIDTDIDFVLSPQNEELGGYTVIVDEN